MKRNDYFLIFSVLIIIVIAFLINKQHISFQSKDLEDCKVLFYSGEDKTNIVFFSSKENAMKYSDFLFEIPPLKENKKEFNAFYIDSFTPNCTLYNDIALFCYSEELSRKSSSCPNDYSVVIDERPISIRSSSFMNVLSINSKQPSTVLQHEFGHAFANLAEEYVPAKKQKTAKNCVSSCDKFISQTDGCFEGCSNANYFRSIDLGIMRSLSSDKYGIFNENLILERMKSKKMGVTGTGRAIEKYSDCAKEEYYSILVDYNKENSILKILNKTIENGCAGSNGFGEFNYTVFDKIDNILLENNFNLLVFSDAPYADKIEGEIFDYSGKFILKIPIIEDSTALNISYNDQTTKLNIEKGARPCRK